MASAKETIQKILGYADIKIDGDRPWDIKVHNEKFYDRVLSEGSLGAGESYMDGWWDCQSLDEFFNKLLKADVERKIKPAAADVMNFLKARIMNLQSKTRSKVVAQQHYDVGNDLYTRMLDKHMQYTCAYWKDAKNLEEAQEHKLHLIAKKLKLKPGMTVLELGGGFHQLAKFLAKEYGCEVTSYNISKEQIAYGRKSCEGLPVKIIEDDYRNARGAFDRVVSIGMCEHVGYKNYRGFLEVAHRCLKDGGLFVMHTIGSRISRKTTDPWIEKYIFPNSMLPSVKQIAEAAEGLYVMEDLHNFGADYDKTLMAWHKNFTSTYEEIKEKYNDRFYRMWVYYLLACAGAFRARKIQLFQFVLAKPGVPGGYERVS